MFTIIGGDGKEYGPATADQIRTWISTGRANLETKAKALGSEEWRRLGDFAEFAGTSIPPSIPAAPAGSYAAPQPATAATAPIASGLVIDTNLADRGMRLLSRCIDWAIEIVLAIPGGVILASEFLKIVSAAMQGRQIDFADLDLGRLILGGAVLAGTQLLLLVVQVWMLSTRGQSIGKRFIGLRVVKLDGSKAGFVHAWLMREFLVTAAGVMLSLLPFIGPTLLRPALHLTDWCMVFRDDRRCLHDLIAGTKVVKA